MPSLPTTLGLRAASSASQPPSLAGAYLIFHFIFAYGLTSTRTLKQLYGLDHNVSPREDLTKYGPAAVASGKITQKQLEMLKRNESAHANSYENYTLFAAAMIWAQLAGLGNGEINAAGLGYTIARLGYVAAYVLIDRPMLSPVRGLLWWTGNLVCLRLFWRGMRALNRGIM